MTERTKQSFGTAMALYQVMCGLLTFVLTSSTGFIIGRMGENRMGEAMLLPATIFPLVGLGGAIWLLGLGRYRNGTAKHFNQLA